MEDPKTYSQSAAAPPAPVLAGVPVPFPEKEPEQGKVEIAPVRPSTFYVDAQEVLDAHSGLSLRFGSHADDSNTCYLQISHKDMGTQITFQRGGAVLSMKPITPAQDTALQRAREAEKPKLVDNTPLT